MKSNNQKQNIVILTLLMGLGLFLLIGISSAQTTCSEGKITSNCQCGDKVYNAGFCCNGIWFDPSYENNGGCPSGNFYFVDQNHPQASDSNSGTEELPWKTLQKAGDTATVGDIVVIKSGTYTGSGGVILHIKNSGTENNPIIFKAHPGHDVIIDGQHQCLYRPLGVAGRSAGIFIWYESYIILDGLHVKDIGCETEESGKAKEYFGIWILNSHHITVQNCKVSGVRTVISYDYCPGINIADSDDCTIQNCELWDIKNRDGTPNGAGVGVARGSSGSIIEHNLIYNSGCGVYLKGSQDSIVRYNLIHDCHYGIDLDWANNATVKQNIVYSCSVVGIWLHAGYGDVGLYSVENNIIYNCGRSLDEGSSGDKHVYNATVKNNIAYASQRVHVHDGELTICRYGCSEDPPNWDSDYNCYYNAATSDVVSWLLNIWTLSELQTNKNQDLNSLNQDPLFVYPPNDFHLQAGSPCLGTGKDGVNMGAYITGNEIIGPIDLSQYIVEQPSLVGDLNDDGQVTTQDYQACINHLLGREDWGEAADINQDGSVNVLDIQEIVNIILGV